MSTTSTIVVAVVFSLMCASSAAPQAPPSVMYARVAYMTLKATPNPQGELKDTLATLERELSDALRLGRTGHARRLLAKGTALLGGTPWTEPLEYARSLVLRTDRTITDSSKPCVAPCAGREVAGDSWRTAGRRRVDALAPGAGAERGPAALATRVATGTRPFSPSC